MAEIIGSRNILNQNEIVDVNKLNKNLNYGIEKCVCKIKQEINFNGKLKLKKVQDFFVIFHIRI